MKKLNVFIDGSWLFKICKGEGVLASRTEHPSKPFELDFSKLNDALLSHVQKQDPECTELGDLYYATSIFEIPKDVDTWPPTKDAISITNVSIEKTKKLVFVKNQVANDAISAGYKNNAIFRPRLRPYMIGKLTNGKFQEKQVDAAVVALLVRSAIMKSEDYHLVITGDSDIIPAIIIAYPEYTKNVVLATTHPDHLDKEHRQSSYSLEDFVFSIPNFFLEEQVVDILRGDYVYECRECHEVFTTRTAIPKSRQPFCPKCQLKRN